MSSVSKNTAAQTGQKPTASTKATNSTHATAISKAAAELATLRTEASKHHEKFEVTGRNAMLTLMSRVYAQYHAAKTSDIFEDFINNVRACLNKVGVKYKTNSKDSSLLIRYIFSDFSDKQVHVYGRSLDVAYENSKNPSDFVKFVENTKGRFDGIRALSASKTTSKNSLSKHDIALSEVENETTLETVGTTDWQEGENYRIFIAVRTENDMADIKDTKLSLEARDKTLLLYLADKHAQSHDKLAPRTEAELSTILQAELAAQEIGINYSTAMADLALAEASGDIKKVEILRSKVKWFGMQKKATESAIKELKKVDKDPIDA